MAFRKYFVVFLVAVLACCAVGMAQRVYLDPNMSVTWDGSTCSGCDVGTPCTLGSSVTVSADCELVFLSGGNWLPYSVNMFLSGTRALNVTADGGEISFFSALSIGGNDAMINVRDIVATSSTVKRWYLTANHVRVSNVNMTRIGFEGTATKFSLVDSQIVALEEDYDAGILQYIPPSGQMVAELENVRIQVNRYLFSPSSTYLNLTISDSAITALVTRSTSLQVFNVYDSTFDAPPGSNRNFIPYGPASSLIFHRSSFTNYGSAGASAWANTPVQPSTAEVIGCHFTGFILVTAPTDSIRIEDTTFTNGFDVPSLNMDQVPTVIIKNVHFVLSNIAPVFVSLYGSNPKTLTWQNVQFTAAQPPTFAVLKLAASAESNFTSSTTFPSLLVAAGAINCEDCDLHFNSSIGPVDYEESGARININANHVVFDPILALDTAITTGASTEVTCNIADVTNGCIKQVKGGAIEGPYNVHIARGRLNLNLAALGYTENNSPQLGDQHYLFNSLDSNLELVDPSGTFNLTIAVNGTTEQAFYRFSPIHCHASCVVAHLSGPCVSNQWCPCLPGTSGTFCENGSVTPPTDSSPTVGNPSTGTPSAPTSNASQNAFFGTLLVSMLSILVALL